MKKLMPALVVTGLLTLYWLITPFIDTPKTPVGYVTAHNTASQGRISDYRAKHILYGDERGGGHMHGTNRPCKSEFPADWDKDKILNTVKRIAANDNGEWEQQNNGYYVDEAMIEGVNVRVVLGRDKTDVITAYPTNVKRNPCPANDNNR